MKRRRFTKEFKARVALEAIKGQRSANELAQEFGVHVNQISLWKKQLLEMAPEAFRRGKDHGIRISMDGKGRAMDNIMVERLWRSVKYEDIYIKDYLSVEDLVHGLRKYFDFYNNERPHRSLGSRTPAKVYWEMSTIKEAA